MLVTLCLFFCYDIQGTNFNIVPEECLHSEAQERDFNTWVIYNTYENRVLSPLQDLDLHFIATTSKKLRRSVRDLVADVKFFGYNKVFGSDFRPNHEDIVWSSSSEAEFN